MTTHTKMPLEADPRPLRYIVEALRQIVETVRDFGLDDAAQMLEKGGGAIVSFASDAAKVATPGEAVTGGALAANVMFCRTAGLELARHNIRVNAVTPSITRGTKTYDRVMAAGFSKKLFEKAERRARLGVAHAENVAPMAVFLASPLASHITGQVVSVNGGISAA